jgi:hypothetical protein
VSGTVPLLNLDPECFSSFLFGSFSAFFFAASLAAVFFFISANAAVTIVTLSFSLLGVDFFLDLLVTT